MSDGPPSKPEIAWNSGICSSFPHLRESGICHSERLVIINPLKRKQKPSPRQHKKTKRQSKETLQWGDDDKQYIWFGRNLQWETSYATELHRRIDVIKLSARLTVTSYGHIVALLNIWSFHCSPLHFSTIYFLPLVTYAKDTAYSFLICSDQDQEKSRHD